MKTKKAKLIPRPDLEGFTMYGIKVEAAWLNPKFNNPNHPEIHNKQVLHLIGKDIKTGQHRSIQQAI